MFSLRKLSTALIFLSCFSTVAAPAKPIGYSSAENVLSLDARVVGIQASLKGNNFKPLNIQTSTTYYIVEPTEAMFQTAETVITMVANDGAAKIEYANIHVPIIYNRKTGLYSAGKVTVKYISGS